MRREPESSVPVRREPELPAPGHRVRAEPQWLAAVQRVRRAAPLPAHVAARQACRVPDDPHQVVVRPVPDDRAQAADPLGPGGRSRVATQARGDAAEAEVRVLCLSAEARSTGASAVACRIGWVIRAFVSHDGTTTGRNRSQGQRAVVHAVGTDCKADQHSSRASGSGNDADRPGRFPRPPLDCICAHVAWPMRSWE